MTEFSMHTIQQQQIVIDSIHLDLELYSDLHELLEHQQQYLLGRDNENLSSSAEDITTLMLEARNNRSVRSTAMKQLGLENTPDGMSQFIHALGDAHRLPVETDWKELMALVEDCHTINRLNEEILNMQHSTVESILKQLPVQGIDSKTYSSSGKVEASKQSIMSTSA